MTWRIDNGNVVNEHGEFAPFLEGDDAALADRFLVAREVEDEAGKDRVETQAILCAHIEADRQVYVPGQNVVLKVIEPEDRRVDIDAVRRYLKDVELTPAEWRALALAANNGWSRAKLSRHGRLLKMLDDHTTNGWKTPYLMVQSVEVPE